MSKKGSGETRRIFWTLLNQATCYIEKQKLVDGPFGKLSNRSAGHNCQTTFAHLESLSEDDRGGTYPRAFHELKPEMGQVDTKYTKWSNSRASQQMIEVEALVCHFIN